VNCLDETQCCSSEIVRSAARTIRLNDASRSSRRGLSGIAALFDVIDAPSTWQGLATIPEFLWELSLGIYLTVKGFRPSPITADLDLSSDPHAAV
jgi:hypothetical protein